MLFHMCGYISSGLEKGASLYSFKSPLVLIHGYLYQAFLALQPTSFADSSVRVITPRYTHVSTCVTTASLGPPISFLN